MRDQTPLVYRRPMDLKVYGLRLLGLWSEKSKYMRFFLQIGTLVNVILIIAYLATIVAEIHLTNSNLIKFDCSLYIVTTISVLSKLYKFYCHHDRIEKLVEKVYRPLDALISSSDSRIKQIVRQNLRQERILDTFFGCCFLFLDISMFCVIFTGHKRLPLPGRFPFDTSVSPLYEIICIYQTWEITFHIAVSVLTDEVIFSLIRWITVQFMVLNINYRNCHNLTYSREENNNDPSVTANVLNFMSSLKISFQTHQHLIELVAEWNAIFNMTMLSEVATNCFIICLSLFQITMGTSNPAYTAKFIFYCGAASTQLLIWCWLGSELTAQSDLIASGLWSCGWESHVNYSDVKSMMIMSIIHTKTILQLKAGKFFVMTMQTFVTVLRSAYSFLALLSASND